MEYWPSLLTCRLFQGMAYEEIETFLKDNGSQWLQFNRGDVLFRRGAFKNKLLIVVEGSVKVSEILKAEADNVVDYIQSGDSFGLAMALNGSNHNVIIEATQKGTAVVLSGNAWVGNPEQTGPIQRQVMTNALYELADTVKEHANKLTYLRYSSLRAMLSAYLLHQSKEQEGVPFQIPMNKTMLADYLSISRAAMVKTFSTMRREGIIDFHQKEFVILNIEDLKSHVAY